MNNITAIKPYSSFNQNSKVSNSQSNVNFKGALGDKVVKEIATNKTFKIGALLATLGGLIGLSKDKVTDVLESFVDRIKGLQAENENLTQQLQQEKATASQEKEALMKNFEAEKQQMQVGITDALVKKDLEIKEKDATIREKDAEIDKLSKYKDLGYVKPVSELEIVTPEDFVTTLNEAQEAMPKIEKSIVEFLFNGTGQEEIIAQLERNNKILKAKQDGITKIPEMQKTYESCKTYIGYDPYIVFQYMMKRALLHDEKACEQLNYPPIMRQVLMNADALSQPLMKKNNYYRETNGGVLTELTNSSFKLQENKNKLIKQGWELEGREMHANGRPYYRFTKDGVKMDIYVEDMAAGNFGYRRIIDDSGNVSLALVHKEYWE